ncbi:hypothetical protein EDD27_7163 [Nonomuraea polychroma]|uniref:Type II toxin-antitoxin system RelE/ParE family toxin n=1 Tax=Nonomuraea polychroma TaxID=46176 RepID=A0A438MG45_9ACTN|nr:hypothetical protein [Nonomuraea polychroma]RVX44431.1 hypothetical protein EDD27_7163 [Nonomuraea polychroma]
MAFTIILGSKIAEEQVDSLTDSEFAALMEVYETLRLVPENGEKLKREAPDGSAIRMITHRGIEVIYHIVGHAVEVVIIRVNRFPT